MRASRANPPPCPMNPTHITYYDRVTLRPGDAFRLTPMPDKLHVFDAASGKSLSA